MVERIFIDFFELFWRKALPQIFISIKTFTFIFKSRAHRKIRINLFTARILKKGLIYVFVFGAFKKGNTLKIKLKDVDII